MIHEVITLKRFPPRPSGTGVDPWLTDELWRLMEDCWGSPRRRPSMAEVLVRMKAIEDARRLASWS